MALFLLGARCEQTVFVVPTGACLGDMELQVQTPDGWIRAQTVQEGDCIKHGWVDVRVCCVLTGECALPKACEETPQCVTSYEL